MKKHKGFGLLAERLKRAAGIPQGKPRRYYIEMAAICVTAVLLAAASINLAVRAVSAKASAAEKYPELYAPESDDDVITPDKTVYITFDDGPSKTTEGILDMLKEERVKATFFVTVQLEDKEYAAKIMKRIIDEGHTIGLHSYTHDFDRIYKNVDSYLDDISKLNDFIIDNTGYRPEILRFPGGSCTSNCPRKEMQAVIEEVTRRGYVFYDWDIVSGDDTIIYPAEQLANTILRGIKGRESAIVLAHDGARQKTTAEAVRIVIRELREQGYSFGALTSNIEPVHLK